MDDGIEEVTIEKERLWHISKNVPVALLFAILMQTAGVVWWASSMAAKVNNNAVAIEEKQVSLRAITETNSDIALALNRLTVTMENVNRQLLDTRATQKQFAADISEIKQNQALLRMQWEEMRKTLKPEKDK